MKRYLATLGAFLLSLVLAAQPALADNMGGTNGGTAATQSGLAGCLRQVITPGLGTQSGLSCDANGNLLIAGTLSVGGTTSNATSGQVTTTTNGAQVVYNYGYNGVTWDQLQVDGSKFLKVNCATGCSGGTVSNATSAQATTSTNLGSISYNYGFNGATWDQLQVDGSKFLKVNCAAGCATGTVSNASSAVATSSTNTGSISYNYGFNGTTWDQLQVDGSKFLKTVVSAALPAGANVIGGVTQSGTWNIGSITTLPALATGGNAIGSITNTGFNATGSTSNASSAVATGAVSVPSVAYNYGFNGTTWDQLQVDGSKFLKTVVSAALPAGANAIGSITNTGFNVTGTLPAYAATPTFNLGTLNGAALDASVTGLQVSQGSTTSGEKGTLALGAVTTAAPTYTTAQSSPVSLDTSGNLRVNCTTGCAGASATTPVVSGSTEGGHVLKASAGTLLAVSVTTGATGGYLMVSNTTTVPADGAVTPLVCVVAPAGQTTSWNVASSPATFSTGISAYFSTTGCFTKTVSATAYINGQVL